MDHGANVGVVGEEQATEREEDEQVTAVRQVSRELAEEGIEALRCAQASLLEVYEVALCSREGPALRHGLGEVSRAIRAALETFAEIAAEND